MTLSAEERNAIVNNRMEKSKQALHDAKCNIEMELWTTAANRLYYACYHMASALLIQNGHMAHTHAGIIRLLGLYFVNTGIIPKEIGKTYNNLFDLRQTGDYDDWRTIEQKDILNIFKPAEEFIATVEKLLQQ